MNFYEAKKKLRPSTALVHMEKPSSNYNKFVCIEKALHEFWRIKN